MPNTRDPGEDVTYSYFWLRHLGDGVPFVACRDSNGWWYMPGNGMAIEHQVMMQGAVLLGMVPRTVVGGGSIDH